MIQFLFFISCSHIRLQISTIIIFLDFGSDLDILFFVQMDSTSKNLCWTSVFIEDKNQNDFEFFFLVDYNPCLQARLDEYSTDQQDMNVIVNHQPISYGEIISFPFTGQFFKNFLLHFVI